MGVFGLDLQDPSLFDSGFPHRSFTGIRRDCPVAWHDVEHEGLPDGGFWSVAGYPECVTVLELLSPAGLVPDRLVDDLFDVTLVELARRPSLLDQLRAAPSLLATATDEFARWTSPLAAVSVVADGPLPLGRHLVSAGERVVCWIASANRDERVFGPSAMELRLDRSPNPHLAYGRSTTAAEEFHARLERLVGGDQRPRLEGEPGWVRSDPPGHRCTVEPAELLGVDR